LANAIAGLAFVALNQRKPPQAAFGVYANCVDQGAERRERLRRFEGPVPELGPNAFATNRAFVEDD
jgi:hypothetical protein